jgi:hypothetical protein
MIENIIIIIFNKKIKIYKYIIYTVLPNTTFIIDVEVSYCTEAPYCLKQMLDCVRGVSTPRI